jgi:hypothetical protein
LYCQFDNDTWTDKRDFIFIPPLVTAICTPLLLFDFAILPSTGNSLIFDRALVVATLASPTKLHYHYHYSLCICLLLMM